MAVAGQVGRIVSRSNGHDPTQFLIEQGAVQMPAAIAAAQARLAADVPVIGVTVEGRHRAYALAAFAPIDAHVVNDLVDGRPVTITHCPRTGCTRVFVDPAGHRPLRLAVGGWVGPDGQESLLLRFGSSRYHQNTGRPLDPADGRPIPFPEAGYEQTTWGNWRQAHPDTDVCVGPFAAGQSGSASWSHAN